MKIARMVAIALMALSLFACKKQEPKKAETAVLSIRINDAELRALEAQLNAGQQSLITTNVTLILDNGRKYHLDTDQITAAKTAAGCRITNINDVINTVALTANADIEDDTQITDWQGKGSAFETGIPLSAEATAVTTTQEGTNTVYTVTLSPKPVFSRLEVFGKITPTANANGKNAFESIEVKEVYMNNYLLTPAGDRYFTEGDGASGFKATPALKSEMKDEITDGVKSDFEGGTKAAAYQLFPKKADETASAPDYFDHVILKLSIKYSADAIAKGYPSTLQTRYVTIVKFAKQDGATTESIDSFLAGTIYKLDLKELSKDFKTKDDGTPDDDNPDTPDPESTGKKFLQVIVKPYTWTTVNIIPDVNGGYKK